MAAEIAKNIPSPAAADPELLEMCGLTHDELDRLISEPAITMTADQLAAALDSGLPFWLIGTAADPAFAA